MRPTPARTRTRALSVSIVSTLALIFGLIGGVSAPATAADSVSAAPASTLGSAAVNIVQAADLSKFQAGRIVDDAVFYDSSTMTEAQIQSFLNGKVKTCQSGYVCLKDFKQTTTNKPADAMCKGYTGGTNESAARIIYKVSQSCGMNPRVILVMLQKEQGLVTHTWPSQWRYDAALGQDCPDTPAGCSDAYKGFFSQMYGGMWQMKRYTNPPGTSNYFNWYPVGQTSQVRYNPNAACGSGPVVIQNKATASLYYYTPYQPNAAAIRAGYGEGDACSAYGNRNFFSYFNDWFGSTLGGGTTTPPTPSFPRPSYGGTNSDGAVLALSASQLIAYPLTGDAWGDRVTVAHAMSGVSQAIVVGDLNGDGNRDLVTLNGDGVVRLHPGDGATFNGVPVTLPASGSNVNVILGAGDFDTDGKPDLMTRTTSGELLLWRGNGVGLASSPITVGRGWASMSSLSAGIDIDGDGATDVVARRTDGALVLYPGDGRGGWLPSKVIGTGWNGFDSVIASPDVTTDGKADLVGRTVDGTIAVYTGNGSGGFDKVWKSGSGWNSFVGISASGVSAVQVPSLPGGVGDVDGDGHTDVVGHSVGGDILLYSGNGAGGWAGPSKSIGSADKTDSVFPLGDFNGDGTGDVGRIDAAGIFWVLPGGSQPAKQSRIGHGWASFTLTLGAVDWDGDGNPDVLTRDATGALLVYYGDGSGGWLGTGNGEQIGKGWSSVINVVPVGDLAGHGGAIAATTPDGKLTLYSMGGDRSWSDVSVIGSGWQAITAIAGGDFDGDGFEDITARRSNGSLWLYPGDGAGRFGVPRQVGQGWGGMQVIL